MTLSIADEPFLKEFSLRLQKRKTFDENRVLAQRVIAVCEQSVQEKDDAAIVNHFASGCYGIFPHGPELDPSEIVTDAQKTDYYACKRYDLAFQTFVTLYNEFHQSKHGVPVGQGEPTLRSAIINGSVPHRLKRS